MSNVNNDRAESRLTDIGGSGNEDICRAGHVFMPVAQCIGLLPWNGNLAGEMGRLSSYSGFVFA